MVTPPSSQVVMPYLILDRAKDFKNFVEKVFNGHISHLELRENEAKIRHGEVEIGGSLIMFADSIDDWAAQPGSLFVYVEDADATFQSALDCGGSIVMELGDKEYGRSGGVKDPTGNTWWITSKKR